jgi:hypothetical protein
MRIELLNLISVQTLIALYYADSMYVSSKDKVLLAIEITAQDTKLTVINTLTTIFDDVLSYRNTLNVSEPVGQYKALLVLLDAIDDCILYLKAN